MLSEHHIEVLIPWLYRTLLQESYITLFGIAAASNLALFVATKLSTSIVQTSVSSAVDDSSRLKSLKLCETGLASIMFENAIKSAKKHCIARIFVSDKFSNLLSQIIGPRMKANKFKDQICNSIVLKKSLKSVFLPSNFRYCTAFHNGKIATQNSSKLWYLFHAYRKAITEILLNGSQTW